MTAVVEEWGVKKNVTLTWEHELNSPQVFFEIYKKTDNNADFIKIHSRFPHKMFKDFFVQSGKTYKYFIVAKSNNGLSGSSDTVSITVNEPIVITGTISGIVTDEVTGVGLKNAKLVFIPKDDHFHFSTNVFTDSLGNYSVELKEGEYYVHISKHLYKNEYYDNVFRINAATLVNVSATVPLNINIALAPFIQPTFFTLKGKITDENGNPLRAEVKALLQNRGLNGNKRTITDSEGNYTIKLRANDTIIVYAKPLNLNYLPEYFDNKLTATEADILVINANLDSINFKLSQRTPYANAINGTLKDTLGMPVVGNITAFRMHDGQRPFKVSTVSDSTGAIHYPIYYPVNIICLHVRSLIIFLHILDLTVLWLYTGIMQIV